MINGKFVIDAVTHAFDARPELADGSPAYRYGMMIHDATFAFQYETLPDPFRMTREEYFRRMPSSALESALFLESPTDLAWYHSIPAWGIWPDLSPAEIGLDIHLRHPQRMFMYGAVSPLEGSKAIDDLERQVEEWDVTGVKLYPLDFINGELRPWYMSDEKLIYPLLERCRHLGVKVVAIHKAVPIGSAPTKAWHPDDVEHAALAFPDLNFEIVHGGFAFLEETAFQLASFENVYVNLEATTGLLCYGPDRFARILGELLMWRGATKIVWGTGTTAIHPAPLVEAFEAFQPSAELQRGQGYAELTEQMKADIFANNFVRMHGLDLETLRTGIEGDSFAKELASGGARPWAGLPTRQAA